MADKIISDLEAIATLTGDTIFPVENSIGTFSGSVNQVKQFVENNFQQSSFSLSGKMPLPQMITIANNASDANNDIDFSNGNFIFDDGSGFARLAAMTKRADAPWSAGTNQGGMAAPVVLTGTYTTIGTTVTGSGSLFSSEFVVGDVLGSSGQSTGRRITAIASNTSMTIESAFPSNVTSESVKRGGWKAPNTWHDCFAIYNPTSQTSDALFSTKYSSPNLPSGYTKKNYRGSCLTDSSGNFRAFRQNNNFFSFVDKYTVDYSLSNYGTSRVFVTLLVPPIPNILAYLNFDPAQVNNSTDRPFYCRSGYETDINNPNGTSFDVLLRAGSSNNTTPFFLPTIDSRVWYRAGVTTDSNSVIVIQTKGYFNFNI